MSLDLDDRQRAMLLEMGVRVWWPESISVAIENIAEVAAPARARPLQTPRVLIPPPEAAAPGVLAEGIAAMDWATLARTVASCQACKLCDGRRTPVFGGTGVEGADDACRQADWLVVGEPPDEAEERAGMPFAEQAGQLLDNMLKAVGASRHAAHGTGGARGAVGGAGAAYVANVVKCRPANARNPEPQELAICGNYLKREVALVQPKVIVAMGRFAAQTLLRDSLPEVATIPLGRLRGQVYRYQGIPVVVTYHPGYLLRTQPDKARAWADLCLALEQSKR